MNPIKRDSRAESSPPRLQFWLFLTEQGYRYYIEDQDDAADSRSPRGQPENDNHGEGNPGGRTLH
jgi:hypothetical protein